MAADPSHRVAEIDHANALAALDPTDRLIVAMRYAGGLTSAEIGEAIGMSAGEYGGRCWILPSTRHASSAAFLRLLM